MHNYNYKTVNAFFSKLSPFSFVRYLGDKWRPKLFVHRTLSDVDYVNAVTVNVSDESYRGGWGWGRGLGCWGHRVRLTCKKDHPQSQPNSGS